MLRADFDAAGLRADVRAPMGFRHGRWSGKFEPDPFSSFLDGLPDGRD